MHASLMVRILNAGWHFGEKRELRAAEKRPGLARSGSALVDCVAN